MMPCRISIYEKEDGLAYVARLNIAEMSAGMPESVVEAMTATSREAFEIIRTILD